MIEEEKNCFETIVKNCFYVIHYEKFGDDLSNSCGDFLDAAVPRAFWGAQKNEFLFIFVRGSMSFQKRTNMEFGWDFLYCEVLN